MSQLNNEYNVRGILQTIDKAGRFVIPQPYRTQLGLNYAGAIVEILLVDGGILLIPANNDKQTERQP